MRLHALALCLLLMLAGCSVATGRPLSGPLTQVDDMPNAWLRVGFVADSQLQTRANYNRVFGYRGPFEDAVVKTAIRPPALDWAARSMLRSHLHQLKKQGAEAIFYLGDGANNGCYDEFALGFQDSAHPAQNEQGVLALLDEFRTQTRIPVFFVLGNHDLLGAGSTAASKARDDLCEGVEKGKVSKLEAMALVEKFNSANTTTKPGWLYNSNWDAQVMSRNCGEDERIQHRSTGCYLAATAEYKIAGKTAQFLLLDTNDWGDVSKSRFIGLEQEGVRGAMSFRDMEGESQTTWFNRHASNPVSLRVALSHYDVAGLVKSVPLVGKVSRKTQLYMDLFTDNSETRQPLQEQAYVVTGHTHAHEIGNNHFTFMTDCGTFQCEKTNRFDIHELNVGSTTDYSNYSTIAQFGLGAAGPGMLVYSRVESEPLRCEDIWDEISGKTFTHPVRGTKQGWPAIGVNTEKQKSYSRLFLDDVTLLWQNLDDYARLDPHKANCIGLYAAAIEAGVDPLNRLPPQR